MSKWKDTGEETMQSSHPDTGPYSLIPLLDNVSLSEDEEDVQDVRITCADFWNDNLYVGTSAGEILHYVHLPSSTDASNAGPSLILASRLHPESSGSNDQPVGIQQIVLAPESTKACVLSNGTLTFYSLPELSPAYDGIKVRKCSYISIVQSDKEQVARSAESPLLIICIDKLIRLIRLSNEKAKQVRTIDLSDCSKAICTGRIACVADPRSYSLLDIVEQQQIPLFEINSQAFSDQSESTHEQTSSVPTESARDGPSSVAELNTSRDSTVDPAHNEETTSTEGRADDEAKEDESSHPPRTSSLNTASGLADSPHGSLEIAKPVSTRQQEQAEGQGRKSDVLQPNIIAVTSSEFLLTTGTSLLESGVGIFVNHDGDVVRGTLQFSSYPETIVIDAQDSQALPQSALPAAVGGYALAIVRSQSKDSQSKRIEVQSLDTSSGFEGASFILDPLSQTRASRSRETSSDIGMSKSTSSRTVASPGVAAQLQPVLLRTHSSNAKDNRDKSNDRSTDPNIEQENYIKQQLSLTTAEILIWSTSSIWWLTPSSRIMQVDRQLDEAINKQSTKSKFFVQRKVVEDILTAIRSQEDNNRTSDELAFLSNRYLGQKASLLLFLDLVVQTSAGSMTYERDKQITEQSLCEADVDPRILLASFGSFFDEAINGNDISLPAGWKDAWQIFHDVATVSPSPDPQNRSWESLLQILKRYLMRWRRKKGYGSVMDDQSLFVAVDFALLQTLLTLDVNHPQGRAIKGSPRWELNAVVDEGVECYERAVDLLEKHQRLYILSRLYQGRRAYSKVLETWKRIVEGEIDIGGELGNGEEEIRDYLTKRKDKALVEEYSVWLANRDPKLGVRVFADPKSQVRFNPQDAVSLLKKRAPNAVKEYLEQLVFGNNLSQYANDLIAYYLDSVVNEVEHSETAREALATSYETYRALTPPKPTYSQFVADNPVDATWWQNRSRLLQLLGGSHSAASRYDTMSILARIEPYKELLVPETIILGGRQGHHKDAIRLLIHGLGDYDTAVSYCVLGGAGTYGSQEDSKGRSEMPSHDHQAQLFRYLLQEFLAVEDLNAKIVQTGELLARFPRWFDIEEVLNMIPEGWSADRVSAFLQSGLRVLQSERCEYIVLRALTSSENLSSSAQVVEKIESYGAALQTVADGESTAQ